MFSPQRFSRAIFFLSAFLTPLIVCAESPAECALDQFPTFWADAQGVVEVLAKKLDQAERRNAYSKPTAAAFKQTLKICSAQLSATYGADRGSGSAGVATKLKCEAELICSRLRVMAVDAETSTSAARKPALPVKVSFRPAIMGSGLVAVFETTVKEDFPILVSIHSKALGNTQEFRLNLNHQAPSELGHMEGANIDPGDEITVGNTAYESLSAVAQ